jgi:hypothetical protein
MRFNPNEYKTREVTSESKAYAPLPNGWYSATIKDVTVKAWDSPAGVSLQLVWQVSEGKHKGRLHWQTLNVEHNDTKRELKARYMLSDVCSAVGYNEDLSWAEGKPPRQLVGHGCDIELIILSPQPPKFPNAKNWLASVRVPVPDEMPENAVERHVASFDDDDVPF